MNTRIKLVSGPVGEGRSKSIAQFPKTSPGSIIACETPVEVFLSQASWNMRLPLEAHKEEK